jgi:hypothetical protein
VRIFERGTERIEIATDPDATIKQKWDADCECRKLLADGWTRVAGEETELASQPQLVDALRLDDDLETYEILSDWLSSRGDPWGALMAVQIAIARLPKYSPRLGATERRDELEREETRLRFLHAARLWGALGEQIVDPETQRYASDLVEADWSCGFIRSARIRSFEPALFRTFAALEVAELVQALDLTAKWTRPLFDVLAERPLASLRALSIATPAFGERRAATFRHDVDARWLFPVLERAPQLTSLSLLGSHSTDDLVVALATNPISARLEELVLLEGQFTAAGIGALAGGSFRKLRDLRLTGTGPSNAQTTLARVAKVVRVNFGPRLHEDDE